MSEDRIERSTLIAAPQERVWQLVTEPGFWVGEETQVAGTRAVEGESLVARNAQYGDFPVHVVKVTPQTYVAYRWASAYPGEALTAENSTLIEFTLSAEGAQTRLQVVESGFAALSGSAELRQRALRDNTDGWRQVFEALEKRA